MASLLLVLFNTGYIGCSHFMQVKELPAPAVPQQASQDEAKEDEKQESKEKAKEDEGQEGKEKVKEVEQEGQDKSPGR